MDHDKTLNDTPSCKSGIRITPCSQRGINELEKAGIIESIKGFPDRMCDITPTVVGVYLILTVPCTKN